LDSKVERVKPFSLYSGEDTISERVTEAAIY